MRVVNKTGLSNSAKVLHQYGNRYWLLFKDGSSGLHDVSDWKPWEPTIGEIVRYPGGTAEVLGLFNDFVWVNTLNAGPQTYARSNISPRDTK